MAKNVCNIFHIIEYNHSHLYIVEEKKYIIQIYLACAKESIFLQNHPSKNPMVLSSSWFEMECMHVKSFVLDFVPCRKSKFLEKTSLTVFAHVSDILMGVCLTD